MSKLSLQIQKLHEQQFLEALERTGGNATAAAQLVCRIGSRGAKNPERSAAVMGSRMLTRVNISTLQACLAKGVTPDKVAQKIDELLHAKRIVLITQLNGQRIMLVHMDATAIDKGIVQAMKIGLGGGYQK
jgi:hypothetical protein